jgi:transcription antitermination factor NusG
MSEEESSGRLAKKSSLKKEEEKWYACYTRPRAEKLVYERLIENGVETFLPLQKTFRVWSDRKKLVEKPLLPSYIFVKTRRKKFPDVFKIPGLVKFVNFEGQPASIPQREIDNLRLLINSEEEIEVTTEKFERGDGVEVISGSLVGLTGELIKVGRRNRFIIRIDSLEQNLVLNIPRTFLKKI